MPDVRLIDAYALRKDIHTSYSDDLGILEHIDNSPTIDAQPVKRGKWETVYEHTATVKIDGIVYETKPKDYFLCSVCGKRSKSADNFCGNCGADMRGEVDDRQI